MEAKNELQKNAIAEARRTELETFQRALDMHWLNSRMDDGRMGRCLALIQREAEMEKQFQERTDHAAIVNAQAEKETKLAIEVAKLRRQEMCELLRRHYLRERDPSLRNLMQKLQAGYVCRDLQQQILHNQYRKLQEETEEKRANDVLKNTLYNDKEALDREEREKMERNDEYCRDLQQQLVNRQKQKQCAYEDTLIEKKMLEEVMRTIADEDQRELEKKRIEREKVRNEMVTFKRARDAWKEKQKQMLVIEERQLEAQRRAAADRTSAVIAERERQIRAKEELNEKIASKILADEAARREREDVIKQLQEQEYLEKNVVDAAGDAERALHAAAATQRALARQVELRAAAARGERQREAEFRKANESKMAAEVQKEKEKEMKNKEKARQYSQELLKQIEENSRRRKQEKELEESRAQYVWDCGTSWRQEVNEERKKIITEHAPHLIGYLQAGVIAKEDLAAVREGADRHQRLAPLDIESMATSRRPHRYSKCNQQCRVLREY
ncbi:meiosis-specific nuclear structural protein 1 isoform X2 [Bombyx mori]|uniref:Meiosis-specific nuclear structural protein 1 n=1 Tax=Bombyx mori TaxID=7091 RepID=A0A8R1WFG3_BOMMO|nr:meiosis-specific nuclear structural protein 1 isoform X2 [Bombyx mori]